MNLKNLNSITKIKNKQKNLSSIDNIPTNQKNLTSIDNNPSNLKNLSSIDHSNSNTKVKTNTKAKVKTNTKDIDTIFSILSKDNPEPKTELEYTDNFTLLVSVVLSAQSTDISVNKATKKLFPLYNTPETIFNLGEEKLKYYIKTIGLYNSKAKNIIALSKILIDKYNGIVPGNFDDLISLPGVGRKTANVILNCAFGYTTIAVDTHVFRVSKRIGLSNGSDTLQVEKDLLNIIPSKWLRHAHHWIILHGRYVCKARKPSCDTCVIKEYCKMRI